MSPRPPGQGTRGASIGWTPAGRGRLIFAWKGQQYRITTALRRDDLPELARARDLIAAEIRAGVFDLAKRFPSLFASRLAVEPLSPKGKKLADAMELWAIEKELRKVRSTRVITYRSHMRTYIIPQLGERDPRSLTFVDLKAFQLWLVSRAGEAGTGVSEKTAANVIKSTLRAFMRDQGLRLDDFEALTWERYLPGRRQQPFTRAERDLLLEWFREHRPFEEYVSLELRILCGVTPSECRALTVGDFSRATGSLRIERSEDRGETNPTKTHNRERHVILGEVADDVATLAGIRGAGELLCGGIKTERALIYQFARAQKALGLTFRSIYQAKHTYATLALVDGEMPSIVAGNLGITLGTLEKHYAAALLMGRQAALEMPREMPRSGGRRNSSMKERVSDGSRTHPPLRKR